jgi:hypothetical protein
MTIFTQWNIENWIGSLNYLWKFNEGNITKNFKLLNPIPKSWLFDHESPIKNTNPQLNINLEVKLFVCNFLKKKEFFWKVSSKGCLLIIKFNNKICQNQRISKYISCRNRIEQ